MSTTTPDGLPPYAADWAAHDGIALMRTLASALTALDAVDSLHSFVLPYPPRPSAPWTGRFSPAWSGVHVRR